MAIIDKEKLKELMAELESAKKKPDGADVVPLIQADIDSLKAKAKESIKANLTGQTPKGAPQFGASGAAMPNVIQQTASQAVEDEAEKQQKISELMATPEGRIAMMNAYSTGTLGALGYGVNQGVDVIRRGFGADIPQTDPNYQKAMEIAHPAATAFGKIGYETLATAPIAIAGTALSPAGVPAAAGAVGARALAPTAMGALGDVALNTAAGAGQGYLLSTGENKSGNQVIGETGASGVIGGALSSIPYIGRFVGAKLGAAFGVPTKKVVNDAGSPTPEFLAYAQQQGYTPETLQQEAQGALNTIGIMEQGLPRTFDDMANLGQKEIDDLTALINPNDEVVKRYADNGINIEELPLAVITQNESIRGQAAAMAQLPIGDQSVKAKELAKKLNQLADDAISRFSGDVAADNFSSKTLNAMDATRLALIEEERSAYGALNDKISDATIQRGARITAPDLIAELNWKQATAPNTKFTKLERRVDELFNPRKWKEKPTFDDVNILRRSIGEGLGFNPGGPFAGESEDLLKKYYGILREKEHDFIVNNVDGMTPDALNAMKALTVQEKKLQDQISFYKSRKGTDTMVGELDVAASNLVRGQADGLNAVFDNIPEQHRRGAMSTILGRALNLKPDLEPDMPSARFGSSPQRFSDAWGQVLKSDDIKAKVRGALGDEGFSRFDSIAKLYNGLARLNAPATGASAVVMSQPLPQSATIRLMETVGDRVPLQGVSTTAKKAAKFFSSENQKRTEALSMVVTTPRFFESLQAAAANPTSTEARKKSVEFMNTKVAQNYLKAIDPSYTREIIAAGGLPLYLASQDKEEVKQ